MFGHFTHTHTCIDTHTHTNTHAHQHTHVHTHTHTHTHTEGANAHGMHAQCNGVLIHFGKTLLDKIMAREAIGLESKKKNTSGYLTHQQIDLAHRQARQRARTGSTIQQIGYSI